MADNNLALPAVESTRVPQTDRVVTRNEEKGATGGTPLHITSCSSSTSIGLASINLTQKTLDKESKENLKGKINYLESKLKREREVHSAMLGTYDDETAQDMEETRYRMYLCWYKQKIQQCKILLDHTGFIQTLKAIPPSLTSSIKSVASPSQCSGQVPPEGTVEMGRPSMAERDAAQADALAAVHQITQLAPLALCATSGSISLIDSDGASVVGTQGDCPAQWQRKGR